MLGTYALRPAPGYTNSLGAQRIIARQCRERAETYLQMARHADRLGDGVDAEDCRKRARHMLARATHADNTVARLTGVQP